MKKKPVIIISKCLGFARCRYDGKMINNPAINKLKARFKFIPVCPEMSIGLGVPRPKIRLVSKKTGIKLIQPSTGKDLTKAIAHFTKSFLCSTKNAEGFILKSRSPSCGISGVKIYSGAKSRRPKKEGVGIFAKEVIAHCSGRMIVDETALRSLLKRGGNLYGKCIQRG